MCFAGPDPGRTRNGNVGFEWGFADKRAIGCNRILKVLFVTSDSGVATNPLSSFFIRLF